MEASRKQVSGTITDEEGMPLVGATVRVKGTAIGTNTDNEGKFSLDVPEGSDFGGFLY